MTTFTAAQALAEADRHGDHVADMLREYAANLAAQAEWPSDEDVETALRAYLDDPHELIDSKDYDVCRKGIRVALQSVRPPAVLSDEIIAWAWKSDGMTGWALGHVKPTPDNTHKFNERNTVVRPLYFASRHAPAKD